MKTFADEQSYFNTVAPRWEQMRSGYFGEEVRQAALLHARLEPRQTAADLGTGAGFILEAVIPRVKKAYGLDASFQMLQTARDNMKGRGLTGADFIEGDLEALPLAGASLDVAFSNMALHHVADPGRALAEVFRVLRPGGRYIATDLDQHGFTWLQEEMHDLWLGFPRAQIMEWFARAGFINCQIDCVPGSCCALSAQKEQAQIGIFVAWGEKPGI